MEHKIALIKNMTPDAYNREQGQYKGKTYSVDQDIRKEYIDMLASGKYTASYIAKMAKISRQTLYN